MKITLIQCPLWGTYEPPIALAQLYSCLKKKGHDVTAFDLNIKLYLQRSQEYKNFWAWEQSDFWYKQELVGDYFLRNSKDIDCYVELLLKKDIDLIGFSVNTASLYMSYAFAEKIKSQNKEIKIVFGGPLFLNKKYILEVLERGFVDIVIAGEGEDTICKLADCFAGKSDISLIPGIAFKRNGAVVNTAPAPAVNLDALPFLDFSDLPLREYDDCRHISLMASRGCIRRCYFCSDAPCWPGYRAMSGKRVFREIAFHKDTQRDLGSIKFLDLEFNGDMKALIEFCDLMRGRPLDVSWSANMVVRPEMTGRVIEEMAASGCEHIIFGIESGSESLLKRMNKYYNIKDADRIIRQMSESGICVTANFMFGFPGETEEDFRQTMDFLRRNARFLSRVYPSRTYFALEEFSYIYDHPDEFGIKPGFQNHLFWESCDGLNIYPFRMDRCHRFCELAIELGVEVGSGVQTSVMQDEWFNLAHYYETKQDYPKVVENLLKYYRMDSRSEVVNKKISGYAGKIKEGIFVIEKTISDELAVSLKQINNPCPPEIEGQAVPRFNSGFSKAFLKTKINNLNHLIQAKEYNQENKQFFSTAVNSLISLMNDSSGDDYPDLKQEYLDSLEILSKKNSILNDWEFSKNRIVLVSSPKMFFLQFAGPCNSSCVFCSRGHDYASFDLAVFKERIESKIAFSLALAQQFIFTGSGEFLQLTDWDKILNYFEQRYPYIEKMFSTNSSSLRKEVVDLITAHKSRYSIHASLHASNPAAHRIMTRMDNFNLIIEQIKYLLEKRKQNQNIKIDLFFVATTLNIEDLPDFVRLAKNLGVDSVIVNYNYIYVPAQKYLSCYFKPELTNRMFDQASRLASDLGINISLPPKFNSQDYPKLGICRELWSQVMLNEQGCVLPCDAAGDCNLKLDAGLSFDSIWNSEYYVNIRQELIKSGRTECYQHCHRANPAAVNSFSSHVIHRGRKEKEIDEFWEDNF